MDIAQIALSGMQNAETMFNRSATRIAQATTTDEPRDVVDLSAEMVSLLEAKNSFTANVNVAQTADELSATTLNILG